MVDTTIDIVPMEPVHIDQVHTIECASFTVPWSRTLLLDELGSPDGLNFAAVARQETSDIVVGYVCARMCCGECSIYKIACRPEYRRKGIGSRLLRHIMNRAVQHDVHDFTLEVREQNAAGRAFYENRHFVSAGRRKRYYDDNREDAIIMHFPEKQNRTEQD